MLGGGLVDGAELAGTNAADTSSQGIRAYEGDSILQNCGSWWKSLWTIAATACAGRTQGYVRAGSWKESWERVRANWNLCLILTNRYNLVGLWKTLVAITKELPLSLVLMLEIHSELRSCRLLLHSSQVTADQWHPVSNAWERPQPGFPRDGSVGPFQCAPEHPARLKYYSWIKMGFWYFTNWIFSHEIVFSDILSFYKVYGTPFKIIIK